jgi:glucose dehydrogenase
MFKARKWMHGAAVATLVAGISAASAQQTIAPASTTPTGAPLPDVLLNYAFVNAERLKNPEDGNWLLFRRTYDGWGYSPLSQITPANVGRLQLVWSFATGQVEGHQAPPIVNNGVMFVATPGNQVLAIEAKTGMVLWRYKRPLPEDLTNLHPTRTTICERAHASRPRMAPDPGPPALDSAGISGSNCRGRRQFMASRLRRSIDASGSRETSRHPTGRGTLAQSFHAKRHKRTGSPMVAAPSLLRKF